MSSDIATGNGESSNCLSDMSNDARQTLGLVRRDISASPVITNLPADILLEIFYTLTFDEESYQSFDQPVPLILGAICHQFRRLAWGRPSLWTDFHLEVSAHSPTAFIQLELVQEWLERSGSCALDVSVVLGFCERESAGSCIMYALSLECHRWRSLSLHDAYVFPFWGMDCRFPLLKDVSFGEYCEPPVQVDDTSTDIDMWTFEGARLRRLAIAGQGWAKDHFRLEWTSIQTVHLCGTQSNLCSFLPLVAENVRDARLCSITKDRTFPLNIRFPVLNSLWLGEDGDYGEFMDDTRSIIASLDVPSLRSLTVYSYYEDEDPYPHTSFSEMVQMIKRSDCALVDLTLFDLSTSTEHLVYLAEHIPTLERWELTTVSYLTNHLFEAMTPSEDRTLVLPRLTRWIYKGLLEVSPFAMVNCFKSRVLLDASANPAATGATGLPSQKLDFVEFSCRNPFWAEMQDPEVVSSFNNDISFLRSRGLHFRILRHSGPELSLRISPG